MSNAINVDGGDEEKGNNELLIKDEAPANGFKSRIKLYMLYGATVGGVLLIVMIIFSISLKFGEIKKKEVYIESIVAVYLEENITIKLIWPKYKYYISSIVVDGKKENFVEYHDFTKKNKEHIVEKNLLKN